MMTTSELSVPTASPSMSEVEAKVASTTPSSWSSPHPVGEQVGEKKSLVETSETGTHDDAEVTRWALQQQQQWSLFRQCGMTSIVMTILLWLGIGFSLVVYFQRQGLQPLQRTNDNLPSVCINDFTTAHSWTEFLYRTASTAVHPDDRCSNNVNEPSFSYSRNQTLTTLRDGQNASLSPCACANPWLPEPRNLSHEPWDVAVARNLALVAQANRRNDAILDVALFGDSITEHWLGTNVAIPQDYLVDIPPVYHELFDGPPTSPIHGLALGIGGDRTSQLNFRLVHGEVLVKARVYWILIGINDFLGTHCTRDNILAGILQSIEMLLAAPHDYSFTVVVSSILPWGSQSLDLNENAAWNMVRSINHALECYVQMRRSSTTNRASDSQSRSPPPLPRLEFFNATDYFLTADGLHVNATAMMPDMLHPSAAGRRVWGGAIVQHVQSILQAAAPTR